jgi:hypothetical protein
MAVVEVKIGPAEAEFCLTTCRRCAVALHGVRAPITSATVGRFVSGQG